MGSLIALGYFFLSIYLTNSSLYFDTIFGAHSINYKLKLIFALIDGARGSMSDLSFYSLILVSVLTGLNLAIIINRINILKNSGKFGLVFSSGGSIFSLASTGCVSCGVPVLGALGLTGSLFNLPFHGREISAIAAGLLLISLIILVKQKPVCGI